MGIHREGEKHTNPNGMCSTVLDVTAGMTPYSLRTAVGERLGFNVACLSFEGVEVHDVLSLPDQAFISAYEVLPSSGCRSPKEAVRISSQYEKLTCAQGS